MPDWYYEKKELKNTPSYQTGLDYDTETRYRREGARFIQEVGKALGLRHDTMATAAVYFHRFYMFHSFQMFPRYVTATCGLFLAGKAEETPKKCRDLIKTVRTLTNDAQFSSFGQDSREEVMTLERVLLQTIKFDLQVDHPYSALLKYAKCLKGDKQKLQKMVQMSWTFVNDSLCTTLCLQWEPEVIAIALMYLAAKLSKFEVKDWKNKTDQHKHWWDLYVKDLETEVLEDICHQVLDLYSQPTTEARLAPASPPPHIGQRPPSAPHTPTPPQQQGPPVPQPPSKPPAPKPAPPPIQPTTTQSNSVHRPPAAPSGYPQNYPATAGATNYLNPGQYAVAPSNGPPPQATYSQVVQGYGQYYPASQTQQGATYGYPQPQTTVPPQPAPVRVVPDQRGAQDRIPRGPPPGQDYRAGSNNDHRVPPPEHRSVPPPEYRSTPPDGYNRGPRDRGPPPQHRGPPPRVVGPPPPRGAPLPGNGPPPHRGSPYNRPPRSRGPPPAAPRPAWGQTRY